ncbi:DUF2971 domain-containing protein [Sphingobacterium sp. JB170]|uniref:DUF2971 domain-containing protein n=1 Tax=Sphingobacterium sp. JB170 TaxID=1434842 RepID=UPI00097F584C|nr:DUF2971 domain-containing protein [Sphingobacterium sp. JB170]SJN26251.1 hypothetical protein FM107_04925 [Sphingobacterium sp. JB170]
MSDFFDNLKQNYLRGQFASESENLLFEGLDFLWEQRYLYKYSNADNGIDNLFNSQIYFNSPVKFNDNKDCSTKLLRCSKELALDILKRSLESAHKKKYSLEQIQKLNNQNHIKGELFSSAFEATKKAMIEKVRVTCFSTKYLNELMWAHYADSYKGVCIEYDGYGLIRHFNSTPKAPSFLRVKYIENLKPVILNGDDNKGKLISWLAYKSEYYSYEDEIRRLFTNHDNVPNPLPIPASCYSAIYLGTRISSENREKVLQHVSEKKSWVKVYNIELDDDLRISCSRIH